MRQTGDRGRGYSLASCQCGTHEPSKKIGASRAVSGAANGHGVLNFPGLYCTAILQGPEGLERRIPGE